MLGRANRQHPDFPNKRAFENAQIQILNFVPAQNWTVQRLCFQQWSLRNSVQVRVRIRKNWQVVRSYSVPAAAFAFARAVVTEIDHPIFLADCSKEKRQGKKKAKDGKKVLFS